MIFLAHHGQVWKVETSVVHRDVVDQIGEILRKLCRMKCAMGAYWLDNGYCRGFNGLDTVTRDARLALQKVGAGEVFAGPSHDSHRREKRGVVTTTCSQPPGSQTNA